MPLNKEWEKKAKECLETSFSKKSLAALKKEILKNSCYVQEFGASLEKSTYVGSLIAMTPSGKIYMPWSSNVEEQEALADELFWELVEERLGEYSLYYFSGEGCFSDVFVGVRVDLDEVIEALDVLKGSSNTDQSAIALLAEAKAAGVFGDHFQSYDFLKENPSVQILLDHAFNVCVLKEQA